MTKTPISFKDLLLNSIDKKMMWEILAFSIWAAVNTLSTRITISFTPTILGTTSGTLEITYFSLAAQIEQYVSMFAVIFGTILFPKVSRILLEGDSLTADNKKRFEVFFIKIARLQLLILGLIVIGFIFCGKDFMVLWAGQGYDASYFSAILLCAPALLFYPLQLAIIGMATIEKIKYCALANIICSAICIGISYPLSYYYGAIGASIAICISTILRVVALLVIFNKHLDIRIWHYYRKSYLSFLLPFAITSAAGILLTYITGSGWLIFIIKVLTITIVYVITSWVIALNNYEKTEFKKMLFRRKS
jgi:O-antigen/teichoic acid export membrane protein